MTSPVTSALQILIVDDHAVVRRGLRELLADELPGVEFGEAETGPEALVEISRRAWSLVLLDLAIPGRDGLEVLKEALVQKPDLRVMILSVRAEDQYALRALRAGAVGYVTKATACKDLTAAVRKVLDGGKYVSPSLVEKMVETLTGDAGDKPLHDGLSDRELQVLRMLAGGSSVKEISGELALSEKTISTYRTRILQKLSLSSTAQLMRYALRVGLVD